MPTLGEILLEDVAELRFIIDDQDPRRARHRDLPGSRRLRVN